MMFYVPPIGASKRELCKCMHWEMTDMITVWLMESPPFDPCSVLKIVTFTFILVNIVGPILRSNMLAFMVMFNVCVNVIDSSR